MPRFDDAMAEIVARDDLADWLDDWLARRQSKCDPVQEAVEQAVIAAMEAGEIETAIAFRVVAKCRSIGREDVAAAVLLESREIDEMVKP